MEPQPASERRATVRELAEIAGGELIGGGDREIRRAASLDSADADAIVFVDGPRYASSLASSRAGAAIVPPDTDLPENMSGIVHPMPALGMAKASTYLHPTPRRYRGVSPQAIVDESAEIGEDAGVAPGAVVGPGARIGARSEIHPTATIGPGAVVGEDCIVHAGVHVYAGCTLGDRVIIHSGAVVGADGYGFTQEPTPDTAPELPVRHRKVPQIGTVIIEDDVEIGANSTIDRAAFDTTRIGRGTKIDNLVMIAHNCEIGRHCLIVGQVGISGSTRIGDYVTIAGQAGLTGHIEIGDRAIIGAQAGVTKSVSSGSAVLGSPAIDLRRARRMFAVMEKLPERMPDLRARVAECERRLAESSPPLAAENDDASPE